MTRAISVYAESAVEAKPFIPRCLNWMVPLPCWMTARVMDLHVPEGFSEAELQASHGELRHTEGLVLILELNSKNSTLGKSFQPDKMTDLICKLPFLGISVLPFEPQQSVDTCDDGKEKHLSCVTSAYHCRLSCSNEIKAFPYVGSAWDLEGLFALFFFLLCNVL